MIEHIDVFVTYSKEEFFGIACLFWCFHKIGIKLLEIIVEGYNSTLKKNFEIPEVIACNRCFAFWAVLITTFNPYEAAIVAVLVYLIDSIFLYLESNIKIKIDEK